MIYFRADANKEIATGHIMRCMSIASALKKLGEESVFITADSYPEKMLRERGFKTAVLGSSFRHMEEELPLLLSVIDKEKEAVLVVDSYQVTGPYLSELRKYAKVVYIDDRLSCAYPVDGVISYGQPEIEKKLKQLYRKNPCLQIWQGNRYIPLREEFQKIGRKDIRREVKDILFTTGGTDSFYLAEETAAYFTGEKCLWEEKGEACREAIRLHIVIGRFYPEDEIRHLKKMAEETPNICLYENISRMSEAMIKCDAALSAGGTTLLELCACGTPTVCFSLADNQVPGSRQKEAEGLMRYAGDARNRKSKLAETLMEELRKLLPEQTRMAYSRRMQEQIDGMGASRLAKGLLEWRKSFFREDG